MFRNSICHFTRKFQNFSVGSSLPLTSVAKTLSATNIAVPVRFRWYETRPTTYKRFGYEDKLEFRGLLPRIPGTKKRLPMTPYCPKNLWTEKRALFGQNDYIDILGDGSIHPTQISYSVPPWLRGFAGHEFQMLLRKRKYFGYGLQRANPDKYNELQKRIRYLYTTHNQRRRFRFDVSK